MLKSDKPCGAPVVVFLVAWALLFCLVVLIYSPGLHGPFVFDDISNIVENQKLALPAFDLVHFREAAFSTSTGPLARPVAMLSFALNHYFSGLEEFPYKLTNVVLHFLNALLVFAICRRLLFVMLRKEIGGAAAWFGSFGAAAIWLVHPIQLTSVLYVVQRMTELSAFFALACVYAYLCGRCQVNVLRAAGWHGLAAIAALLAILSKENQVILPCIVFLVEFLVFRFSKFSCSVLWYGKFVQALVCICAALFVVVFVVSIPSFVNGFSQRPFTATERLLTESRVLFFYLFQILVPDISRMHLFHDEIRVSHSLLSPITTAMSVGGLACLVVLSWWKRLRWPLLALATGWFLIGHLVESSVVPLELVHAHRNYFPMIGICIAFGGGLAWLFSRQRKAAAAMWIGIVVLLSAGTWVRANDWRSWPVLVVSEAEKNPNSPRSQYEAGRYYYWMVEHAIATHSKKTDAAERQEEKRSIQDQADMYDKADYAKAMHYLERTIDAPESIAGLTVMLRLDDLVGNPPNEGWENLILERLRSVRMASNDINKLLDLFVCVVESKCTIRPAFLNQVAATAIESPVLHAYAKSMVLSVASDMSLVSGRADFARYYLLKALEISPTNFAVFLKTLSLASALRDEEMYHHVIELFANKFQEPSQLAQYDRVYPEKS
ncbi:Hypothetical protein HDN1F_30870 [gamma proteobacterium HdN1]|nr:Hypothetical protein HDN1F_30870 [gamma proteobacterium HdN1]